MQLSIGLDTIKSYKRLPYTPWHAIAEFVDNSTQSYFNNEELLQTGFRTTGQKLEVSIVYDKDQRFLRIADNAMGMSHEELDRALHVAMPPENTSGRSKYGMGLKTAACWMGNFWTVRTKKLGDRVEHTVTVDVERVASGDNDLPYSKRENLDPSTHYTVLEISDHNQEFHGRTLGKIRDFLSSMYREDLRHKILKLEWQGVPLAWEDFESKLLIAADGRKFKKEFEFSVDGKNIHGWVGILDRGSRRDAGFSILHCGRVVRGWPDSWRPQSIYGQMQGSNDLVNQRLVGEIWLSDFDVSHTKDDILWVRSQEEDVEEELLKACSDYREIAKNRRKGGDDERGPSETETAAAVSEFRRELESPEFADQIQFTSVPPQDVVEESVLRIASDVKSRVAPTFVVQLAHLTVKVYVVRDMSPNDPYVVTESASDREVITIVNASHPHWKQLKGSDGVLNFLRHCVYDSVAEWQALTRASRLDPSTIKLLKDRLLRIPFEMEAHDTSMGT